MGRPAVKWRDVERWCARHGYEIRGSGGDKMIIAPHDGKPRARHVVCIGHQCCSSGGDVLYDAYVLALKRAFGVTREELRGS